MPVCGTGAVGAQAAKMRINSASKLIANLREENLGVTVDMFVHLSVIV